MILTRLLVLTIVPVVARLVVVVLLPGLLMALLEVTLRIGLLLFTRRVRLAATRLRLHDTVVLSREGDLTEGEDADPRASVPAWEDIVFGVRRHR